METEKPFVIEDYEDLRKLPEKIRYDVDALLVGTIGENPLEVHTLSRYGLPMIGKDVTDGCLGALGVKKFLRQSEFLYIGEIPSFSAPNGPSDFSTIERRLRTRVRHIETDEFYRCFDRFSDDEVMKELENWKRNLKITESNKKEPMKATRVYLALRPLCDREDANGVTIDCDVSLKRDLLFLVSLFNRLIDGGIMCGCEGDITAMLSSLILHAVSDQSVLMGDFGYKPGAFEAKEGEATIEHDVIPLSMDSTKYIIRDYHGRKSGVTGYADIKANQPMTLLNMDRSLDGITVIEGTVEKSEDDVHCRVIIHMNVDGDIRRIPEIAVDSQHISITFGHWFSTLKEVGNLLGLKVLHL